MDSHFSDFENINLPYYHNKWLIIDIDGVLAIEDDFIPLEQRKVISRAQEALKRIQENGYKILLFTSRFRSQKEATIAWLEQNQIPYDDILFGKPRGALYIDDRGYRFQGWDQFFKDVNF